MAQYLPPLRDMQFVLHEVLGAVERLPDFYVGNNLVIPVLYSIRYDGLPINVSSAWHKVAERAFLHNRDSTYD